MSAWRRWEQPSTYFCISAALPLQNRVSLNLTAWHMTQCFDACSNKHFLMCSNDIVLYCIAMGSSPQCSAAACILFYSFMYMPICYIDLQWNIAADCWSWSDLSSRKGGTPAPRGVVAYSGPLRANTVLCSLVALYWVLNHLKLLTVLLHLHLSVGRFILLKVSLHLWARSVNW